MSKDDKWFASIKWDKVCLECQRINNGICSRRGCAEMCYDENGNLVPSKSIVYDGDYKREERK